MMLDYSRLYATYHSDDPAHRNGLFLLHRRMLEPHLPADRSLPILDVGCGRGYALEDLARLGYTNCSGIDVDPGQVLFARTQGLNVAHESDTVAFLDRQPSRYAVILLMDVLEHVPRPEQPGFLRAAVRSLRPDGRLICSVPNAASAIAGYWQYNDYTHHWSFTNESLCFLLGECGFTAVRCSGIEFLPRPRYLFWLPIPRTVVWWLRCAVRARQRLTLIGELGWKRGWTVALTPNLVAVAEKAG